jgi:hypothetical protein
MHLLHRMLLMSFAHRLFDLKKRKGDEQHAMSSMHLLHRMLLIAFCSAPFR